MKKSMEQWWLVELERMPYEFSTKPQSAKDGALKSVEYAIFKEDTGAATDTYGITYTIPGEQHILCDGMYEWAAKWLVDKLNADGDFPRAVVTES